RAFFCGSRKLRAKPSFTLTTSPIWPSFSTRSRSTTCIVQSPFRALADDIGKERKETRALDGTGEFTLLLGRHGRDTGRNDLAALGNIALQKLHILVIDLRGVGTGEGAGLAAAEEGPARGLCCSAHYSSPPSEDSSRSRRGPRSRRSPPNRSPRSPKRSPPRRSPRSPRFCIMADGSVSCSSTRIVMKRRTSSLMPIWRSISAT